MAENGTCQIAFHYKTQHLDKKWFSAENVNLSLVLKWSYYVGTYGW